MKLLMGSRSDTDLPNAISVLNFVDRVAKELGGFREQYDRLREVAHPNWAATTLLYAKFVDASRASYGSNVRGFESIKCTGAVNPSAAMMSFEHSYNRITDIMPAFMDVCGQHRFDPFSAPN